MWGWKTIWLWGLLGGCDCGAGGEVQEGDADADTDADTDSDSSTATTSDDGEICGNGLDDDADGFPDDGCECGSGDTQLCYLGDAGLAGIGECDFGEQSCVLPDSSEFGTWGPCGGSMPPSDERCNALDDDCDGTMDEGCECEEGASRACYEGPEGTEGVGLCHGGQQSCEFAEDVSVWGDCVDWRGPADEICDELDNDCDGETDEGCLCDEGLVQPCYDGPAGTRGVGICTDGEETCEAGAGGVGADWSDCIGWQGPEDEVCDLADNDCDGIADEGCACDLGDVEACYSGAPVTRGVGECNDGSRTCVDAVGGGSEWGACVGEALPVAEVCNGLDDDCDGTVDDGVCNVPPVATCPGDVETTPLVAVDLDGSAVDADGVVASYLWEVIDAPPGSIAVPIPDDAASTTFTPDLVGVYTLRLTVTDDEGNTDTCLVQVTARGNGLRVEVYWNPPDDSCDADSPVRLEGDACDASDVDLHLLHPDATRWFHASLDCFYGTCLRGPGLDWDLAVAADDPRLDLDDVTGHGPENANIDDPVVGNVYTVGAHHFQDDGYGDAEVYVNIYCGDVAIAPAASYGPKTLSGAALASDDNDFWKVADVEWNPGDADCTVVRIDDVVDASDARLAR